MGENRESAEGNIPAPAKGEKGIPGVRVPVEIH